MHPYLAATEYATRGLLDLLLADQQVLEQKQAVLAKAKSSRASASSILVAGAPPTGFGENTTPYFKKKRRDAQFAISALEPEISKVEEEIIAKLASHQALAGAILQIAKQGISSVKGNLDACPPGRSLGSESLKNVIWQGRNQALHWEDRDFRAQVTDCFAHLASDFGADFQLESTPRSLALEITRLLGWTTYEQYECDLTSLLC